MIAVDTNVLLRLLLNDSPAESASAKRLLEERSKKESIFVPVSVIVEMSWVLRGKGYDRGQLAYVLQSILELENVSVSHNEAIQLAISMYASGKAEFADYLIQAEAQMAGARSLATFDKALCKEQTYCRLPAQL